MKKVLLFLSQGFEECEASALIDVCGWSRVVKDVQPFFYGSGLLPDYCRISL